jgi:multidrug efflux pump subunit AcrA (membrane-fusion protein)
MAGCVTPTPAPPVATYVMPTATREPLGDVYTVTTGTLSENMELRGSLEAQREADLFFTIDGKVKRVYVDPGETVRAGDLVAELDASNLQDTIQALEFDLQEAELRVGQAQTAVDARVDVFWAQTAVARAQVAAAQASVERQRAQAAQAAQEGRTVYVDESGVPLAEAQLSLTQASAQAEVDAARSNLALVELARDQTQAQLVEARDQLSQTLLAAPIGGNVQAIDISTGAGVQAYDSVGIIVDPSDVWVSALASAQDIEEIAVGQSVEIRLEALPNQTYEGTVEDLIAEGNSSAYQVVVAFDSPRNVPPATEENVRVVLPGVTRTDVPVVPNAAITTFAGQAYVQVVQDDDTTRRTEIETGISDGAFTEVVSGLQPGQVIKLP